MSALVLRLQTSNGVKRITFDHIGHANVFDLKNKIFNETGIPPGSQKVALDRSLQAPLLNDDDIMLTTLKLKRGDFVYLQNKLEFQGEAAHTVTPQCQHGPMGRCLHCSGPPPGVKDKTPVKCNHGPHTTCVNCSEYIKAANEKQKPTGNLPLGANDPVTSPKSPEAIAAWLCNHPSTVFCPKCIPKKPADPNAKPKVDLIPFKKHLADLSQYCKYRHSPTTTCAMCLPPPFPRYRFKLDCDRHLPYPKATCTHCAPASVVLRPQQYRHVDGISLPGAAVEYMYKIWCRENRRETNRAWLLFGRVIDEPDDKENTGSRRSVVGTIYEPFQTMKYDKVTLEYDDALPEVIALAKMFNMEVIGWMFTTGQRPTDNDKYGGKVLLSGNEVVTAASLQYAYSKTLITGLNSPTTSPASPNNNSTSYRYSEMVTVVLEHGEHIEPVAYMVSDQAACMFHDGVLQASDKDPYMLVTPKPDPLPVAPIVYHDHPLGESVEYLPDNLLVKVRTMTGDNSSYLFHHYDFPSRTDDKSYIHAFLEAHIKEPLHIRLSDFNLLHAIQKYFDPSVFAALCRHILLKQELDEDLGNEVTIALLSAELLPT